MKKLFSAFCALVLGATLVGCSFNPFYIKEKILAGSDYDDAKKLAEKVNDIDIEKEMGVSINFEKTSLNDDTSLVRDEDGYYNLKRSNFSAYNYNIISDSFYSLENALEEAKGVEELCFTGHPIVINQWDYWYDKGSYVGQVRSMYDNENKNDFTFEKNAMLIDIDENNNRTPIRDGVMGYWKYNSKINKKGKLEINSINLRHKTDDGSIIWQSYFKYIEGESFDYYFYETKENETYHDKNSNQDIPCQEVYYNIEHADLNAEDKSYYRLNNFQYYKDGALLYEVVNHYNQHYLEKYIIDDHSSFENGVYHKFINIADYNGDNLLTAHEDKSADIYFGYLDGFTDVRFKDDNNKIILNNGEEVVLSDEYCGWSLYNMEPEKNKTNGSIWMNGNHNFKQMESYLDSVGLKLRGDNDMFEIEKIIKKYSKNYKEKNAEKVLQNFTFFDKEYRKKSMAENPYKKFYTQNNVDSEIEGEVKFENDVLDLTNFKITIDKGYIFEEGKEYDVRCKLWIDDSSFIYFTIYKAKCENGKVVLDKLRKYAFTEKDKASLIGNKKTRISLQCVELTGDLNLLVCDIEMDNSTGTLNGKPVPISYEAVEWQ